MPDYLQIWLTPLRTGSELVLDPIHQRHLNRLLNLIYVALVQDTRFFHAKEPGVLSYLNYG